MVEDLIQESMAKGEFSNLKGSGKPLQYQNHNPYVDTVTQKINQVRHSSGFIVACSYVMFFAYRF